MNNDILPAWDSVKNEKIRLIIKLIGSKPRTPKKISEELRIHEGVISRYLRQLKKCDLVKVRRDENQLYYSLNHHKWEEHVNETIELAGESFSTNYMKSISKEKVKNTK